MKVTIYTSPECEHCKAAKEFLRENNVSFDEKDVLRNRDNASEMIAKSGKRIIPVIDVDGSIVAGFDQDKLEELLGL
ncbi:MAG: NrdH-redoxin [Bacteroidia bacterium]|nr:NrdH-redoxin [Bacteroidia bacterium]